MSFFSIIIPAYNRAHLINQPIESILKQDYDDFEIVIVDDGSTDHTRETIKAFQEKDARIKYLYQQNAERGAARNSGFKISAGKYVIFFDSDDIMCPNHLSVLKSVIDKNPGIRFLTTKFRLTEGDKTIPLHIDTFKEGWHEGKIYLTGSHTGVMICISKENPGLVLFEENRKYATLEDWMFLTRNILRDKIYIIDQYTVIVNNHDQRSSRIDNQAIIYKRLLARDWIKDHLQLTPEESSLLDGYSYRFCAIHAYLDDSRWDALRFAAKAMRETGADKGLFILLVKILIGRKGIQILKSKRGE